MDQLCSFVFQEESYFWMRIRAIKPDAKKLLKLWCVYFNPYFVPLLLFLKESMECCLLNFIKKKNTVCWGSVFESGSSSVAHLTRILSSWVPFYGYFRDTQQILWSGAHDYCGGRSRLGLVFVFAREHKLHLHFYLRPLVRRGCPRTGLRKWMRPVGVTPYHFLVCFLG